MARIARYVAPGLPHHVTQRGNRRERVFFADDDYRLYRDLLREACDKADVSVWAYCLMPDHVHLILTRLARSKAPTAWRLLDVALDEHSAALSFSLNRKKLRTARRREGRYLLRTNLTDKDPALLWQYYMQLVAAEEAFKNLKGDLAFRPIFHHDESRIEAHIFIAFLAYCMQITLTRRLHALAPGLTARSALEKFAAVQMIDVHLPTTDGREIVLTRYTQPEPELQLLIRQLKLRLPTQPPPKITAAALAQTTLRSEDLRA